MNNFWEHITIVIALVKYNKDYRVTTAYYNIQGFLFLVEYIMIYVLR